MVEAKFYTTALSLGLARDFLGLAGDLVGRRAFFVFNGQAGSVEKLLAHKNVKWEHRVDPEDGGAVERLGAAFQVAFRDYKARTRN